MMSRSIEQPFDAVVIGAGAMGATTALHLARGGMRTALVDRGEICREASGVNAGTLTLHMTRAALIPYAMKGRELWIDAPRWLGSDVGARSAPGLSLAFTPAERDMLEKRAEARSAMGAPIRLVTPREAKTIEPGLNDSVIAAAFCELDGHVTAYLTGRAYRRALVEAGAIIMERTPVEGLRQGGSGFEAEPDAQDAGLAERRDRVPGEAHVADEVVGDGLDAAPHGIADPLPAAADQHGAVLELLQ